MPAQSIHPPPDTWNARSFLTIHKVAEWARVRQKTVYPWIKDSRLEAIQFGPRTFRIPEDTIGKFLNKNGYSKSVADRKANGR